MARPPNQTTNVNSVGAYDGSFKAALVVNSSTTKCLISLGNRTGDKFSTSNPQINSSASLGMFKNAKPSCLHTSERIIVGAEHTTWSGKSRRTLRRKGFSAASPARRNRRIPGEWIPSPKKTGLFKDLYQIIITSKPIL